MALTESVNVPIQFPDNSYRRTGIPVAANTVIYRGGLTFIDANGRAVAATTGAEPFIGVSESEVDNSANASPSTFPNLIDVRWGMIAELPYTGAPTVGAIAYAVDDESVTPSGVGAAPVGIFTEILSATMCRVLILQSNQVNT